MKKMILLLAVLAAFTTGHAQPLFIANPEKTELVFTKTQTDNPSTLAPTMPTTMSIRAGTGQIVINFKTGQVDTPKDMILPDAAVAFWLRVAQCFPEIRSAILTGDPTPLTTEWKINGAPIMRMMTPQMKAYELGLRSDGVVVWREVK
jgi:hypothetical protein